MSNLSSKERFNTLSESEQRHVLTILLTIGTYED